MVVQYSGKKTRGSYTIVCFALIVFLLTAQNLFAKKTTVKELQEKLEHAQNDSVRIAILLRICPKLAHEDPDSALVYVRKALSLATKRNSPKEMADCYYYFGDVFYYKGNADSAFLYLNKESALRVQLKDTNNLAYNYRKFGDIYYQKGQLTKAMKSYTRAINLWLSINKIWDAANAYVDMGNINYSQRKFDKAIYYYLTASTDFERTNDLPSSLGVKMNIGSIYLEQKRIQEAKDLFSRIHEDSLVGKVQVEVIHGYYINNLILWSELKDRKKADQYFEKALKIYNESKNPVIELNQAFSTAQHYILFGEYRKAIDWLKILEKSSVEIGSLDYQKVAYNLYAQSYAGMKNYKLAFESMQAYDRLKDSIMNTENRKQVAELEGEFQSEKKELENKNLRAEAKAKDAELAMSVSDSKRQNLLVWVFAVGLVLAACFLYVVNKSLRENKKKNKIIEQQKAEVDAAYSKLNERNKEVLDSIKYARRIQAALMNSEKYIERNLKRLSETGQKN